MTNEIEPNPKKKKKYLLLVANIFPLFAVIFLNWSVFQLIFVYFSETVLFMMLSLVKIFFLKIPISSKIGNSLLYLFAFGIFILFAGIGIFLYYFVELQKTYPDYNLQQLLNTIFNLSYFISLAIFFGVEIYYMIKFFIKKKEYLNHTPQTLIREPGLRIWILVMITLISVALITFNKSTSVFVLAIFVFVKTLIDYVIFKQKENNVDVRDFYE